MTVTAYHTSHAPYTLSRIEADFSKFDFSKPEGAFLNTETNVPLTIEHVGDTDYKVMIAEQAYSGQLLTPTLLKAGHYSIVVHYEEDQVAKLLLDGDRIRKVVFEPN